MPFGNLAAPTKILRANNDPYQTLNMLIQPFEHWSVADLRAAAV